MGIGKEDAPGSETIHVGGKCLRMPLEATDPVVQVIDRNKKNVWTPRTRGARQNQGKGKENKRTHGRELPGLSASSSGNQTHVLIFVPRVPTGIDPSPAGD
jgi:hypothetical protein